ncbi:MAG TPA: pre-peptidase C-terminal domain-containing protein [Kofleriaceae bacterium]|nr:pre-peptidase C-terminal domain-containing protein [Kofleriaceae bacterium]
MGYDDVDVGSTAAPSFEEFLASTYQVPGHDGLYIVDGDTPVVGEKLLREFYNRLYGTGDLIVNTVGGLDDKWNSAQKLQLTYCISDSFGGNKNAVINAMAAATEGGWEEAANVNFTYVPSEDGNCNTQNQSVLFDVRPTSGQPFLARSFFPSSNRSERSVVIDQSSFSTSWPLSGILAHELGHTLGFRHEHTRPEAGQCFEDNNWRPLTPYDSTSVMHYPQCGGTGPVLTISDLDIQGAQSLYGAPDGSNPDPDPEPEPDPEPTTGTPQSGAADGTVARNQQIRYQPLPVLGGSIITVSITGTGDADLYLRFDADPTTRRFDCRPYLYGSEETCSLDVPGDASSAHIMVRGYTRATYHLTAEWVEP